MVIEIRDHLLKAGPLCPAFRRCYVVAMRLPIANNSDAPAAVFVAGVMGQLVNGATVSGVQVSSVLLKARATARHSMANQAATKRDQLPRQPQAFTRLAILCGAVALPASNS